MLLFCRFDFCTEFLKRVDGDPNFVNKILWTDESGFTLDGYGNVQQIRYWSKRNPNFCVESMIKSKTLHIWAGISSNGIIGPFFFERTITAEAYLDILQNKMLPQFQNLSNSQDIYFMQDGAGPHYALTVRNYLNNQFPERWIGRGGPI